MSDLPTAKWIDGELFQPRQETLEEIVENIDKFMTHSNVVDVLAFSNQVVSCWDFNTSLGDTIREKYDSLQVKIVEVTAVLKRNGAAGYFWLVASPEVCAIFECTGGFYPDGAHYVPMGCDQITYLGTIGRRWRLYCDPDLEANKLLVGANSTKGNPEHYARISIANFVI